MSESDTSPEQGEEARDLLAERREKLERLREAGIEPFPHVYADREDIGAVRESHEGLEAGAETDSSHRIAGRTTVCHVFHF